MPELRKRHNAPSGLSFTRKSLLSKIKFDPRDGKQEIGDMYPQTGDQINLSGFEALELCDGEKVALKDLMSISIGGIILFSYIKANTPACECGILMGKPSAADRP